MVQTCLTMSDYVRLRLPALTVQDSCQVKQRDIKIQGASGAADKCRKSLPQGARMICAQGPRLPEADPEQERLG